MRGRPMKDLQETADEVFQFIAANPPTNAELYEYGFLDMRNAVLRLLYWSQAVTGGEYIRDTDGARDAIKEIREVLSRYDRLGKGGI